MQMVASQINPSLRTEKLLRGKVITEADIRDVLTEMIESLGSQKAVAEKLGFCPVQLNDALHGKRPVSGNLASKLGWERVVVFRKK